MKVNIYDYSRDALAAYFIALGSPKFRATQIYEAVYRQRITDFTEITNLKKEIRIKMQEDYYFGSLEIVKVSVSADETEKYLYQLPDGNLIETVLMKHDYGYSVCVTTQVGCNMGCLFCASGQVKKIRDLTPGEMVMQVVTIDDVLRKVSKRVSHVVIMGIGEPFDNYDNVLEFIKIINDPKGLAIGSRHITLSTCGVVPKIYEFSAFPLQVNLAISLHFATDEKRNRYMKINKAYNLETLFKALHYYYKKTNRRITIEYILLLGINDSLQDADALMRLVRGLNCYVNLIPYNETGIFKRTDLSQARLFFEYLIKNNINVVTRKEQGHDINAACGQLRIKEMI
ncbi:MAG: 23S rRNA (adenine(2503)-C(2))-methyltransferase RlmN [Bacilli bacterium]|nr:23S rRNA (adenine(2503)-C(2))-methyltransferase RlmN [Bacilli bacterium]MDD4076751.1 23S rRNA (adenine(2503)-C(2))-methyltransferase RlmN [Bacilli bacterium]MDD4388372.1 23S rRNA (adenine(2503)-C(2))-methyltransferase RlmN [Bacilli bacterium]